MVKKSSKYPAKGELVVGEITKVNPFSAFVRLGEYPGVEGMIHISEVARKWIRDIRDFVKEGQKVVVLVVRVDEEKGHIALSLKRVGPNEKSRKLKEIKSEQKAEKMLEAAARGMDLTLDRAYEEVGFQLQEQFGEMFEAFKRSMTPEGRDLMKRKGIPDKWVEAIRGVAEKALEEKETEVKGSLELKSYAPNGAEIIRKALTEAESKHKVNIKYISAPRYQISMTTKNAKEGKKTITRAAEDIISEVMKSDGEGRFESD